MCVHTVTWERHSKSNFCSEASNGLQNCSQWKPSSWSLSTSFKKKIQHQTNRRHRQALLERMEWHLQVCTGPMPPPVYKVGGATAPMLGSGCYTQSCHLCTKWWGDGPDAGLWVLYTEPPPVDKAVGRPPWSWALGIIHSIFFYITFKAGSLLSQLT